MGILGWSVFCVFLAYVIWDGARRGSRSKDLEGYFAGSRQIPWWAAGLSIMATQASAITVIGTTGQGHDHGMEFVQTYFGLAFAMVLLCVFFVPLYRSQPILTAYAYLERRFGPATRSLASLIFLVSRCLALSVVLYAPAVVLSMLLGLDELTTILIVGVLTTGYTMIGGMQAVIWTDVKQMVVIIAGLFVVFGILLWEVLPETGGLSGALRVLGASAKLNAVELEPGSLSLWPRGVENLDVSQKSFWEEKYNFWSGTIGGLFLMLAYFGCDQSQVQRLLTSPSVRQSRMALLVSAFAKVPMQVLVLLIGVFVYLFFVFHPSPLLFSAVDRVAATEPAVAASIQSIQNDHDAALAKRQGLARQVASTANIEDAPQLLASYQASVREVARLRTAARQVLAVDEARRSGEKVRKKNDTNFVFPHFILGNLHPLLLGLLIAAIFAAAMSSVDSVLNSLTAASVVDFYKRWFRPNASEAQALKVSRLMTLFWGAFATAGAILLFRGAGSVIEQVNKVGSYFYGSLLGVFVLAMCCRRAGAKAGFFGLCGGMAAVLWTYCSLQVAFLWYNVIGCLGVLITGALVSRFERGR